MTGIKAYRETACGFKSQHIFPHSKNSLTTSARSSSSAHDVIVSKACLRVLIGVFDFCCVLFWKMNEQLLHWWSLLSVFYIFVLNTISETNERVTVCFSVLENERRDKTSFFLVLFWKNDWTYYTRIEKELFRTWLYFDPGDRVSVVCLSKLQDATIHHEAADVWSAPGHRRSP